MAQLDFRLQSCYPLTQIPRKWHCPQPIRALGTETQGVCVGWGWGRRGRWGTQHGSGPGAALTGGRSPRVLGAMNLSSEDEASSPPRPEVNISIFLPGLGHRLRWLLPSYTAAPSPLSLPANPYQLSAASPLPSWSLQLTNEIPVSFVIVF